MSHQRRRGIKVTVYKTKVTTDRRGNRTRVLDRDNPYEVTAAFIPGRSSEAEVPGQLAIKLARLLVDANLPDVDLWSMVEVFGSEWDIVAPPHYHHGTARHTRHLTLEIRQRGD